MFPSRTNYRCHRFVFGTNVGTNVNNNNNNGGIHLDFLVCRFWDTSSATSFPAPDLRGNGKAPTGCQLLPVNLARQLGRSDFKSEIWLVHHANLQRTAFPTSLKILSVFQNQSAS